MVIHEAAIAAAPRDHLEQNLQILALVTLAASVCLLVGILAFNPLRGVRPPSGWRLYALPLAVMLLAQGAYTWHSIDTFQ
ncbi:hypothetical protein RZS08_09700, partial [Arthrospira platensis SPKY1]|nr:hypothetical protein [Arthrospira platensis SPKY1]